MRKLMTALALAAFLSPGLAMAQSAGSGMSGSSGTSSGGSSSSSGMSGGANNAPSDCTPNDTRPACQQAQLPSTTQSPNSTDQGRSNVQTQNPNQENANPPATGDIGSYGSPEQTHGGRKSR